MLCSTVIPTVGRATLTRAVLSALEQDLAPDQHQIIVVNDSGRPLPAADWQTAPAVTVLNTNRCERSVACNVGAAAAHGEYLKFLHDDDYLLPGSLSALVRAAQTSGCDFVYGGLRRVDNDNAFISLDLPVVSGNLFAMLLGGDCFHPGVFLIRRATFLGTGGFDPQFKVREDYDFQLRLALTCDFGRTDQVVAVVRIGGAGTTADWARVAREHRRVREKNLDAPGALGRIADGVRSDPVLRGRACRAYLASAVGNLQAGHGFRTVSRVAQGFALANWHVLQPDFWRGINFRTEWHATIRHVEDAHFSKHQSESRSGRP